ncbi:hypothetical protein E2P81_ATG05246 [Venturia nashicola]|uniref:Pyruvate dehydrogenase protein x component n=1 Tax=Venturia nashicola TaxID=86259 RepID=A0A4Z1PD76_9PEZI|nr:hypothetical protein E6O75_ATG05374 [Venturia nashicola]TLD32270.1 hypothetical protein E2P81_ATG05246 [Venturia nashicola]
MPALSPTMTEGNIASWKIKEGDSFVAGDVLLEVETDKATMDVEAQDDGKLAKIIVEDGSKGVTVGSRIGVLADEEDDLSTLEIPPEESAPKAEKKAAPPPKEKAKSSSPAPSKPESHSTSAPDKSTSSKSSPPNKKYPLYPSVEVLLHTHNVNANSINATGPNGRLLKGDVLAFLKEIPASSPQKLEERIAKLSHLDLSNITPAAPKSSPKEIAAKEEPKVEKAVEAPVELSVPVSLASVLQVQKRMSATLGITLPLSTFIARAVALANEDLPSSPRKAPTADELFDHIVGVSKISKSSPRTKDGSFKPQVIALPDPSAGLSFAKKAGKKSDPFDAIVGLSGKQKSAVRSKSKVPESLGTENVFSLSVVKGTEEERRAKVFLERVKSLVEVDPGRLVL